MDNPLILTISLKCSFFPPIRAVLADRFKGLSDASEPMIMGRMLHEVFQRVLLRRQEVGVSMRGMALKDAVMEEIRGVVSTLESLDQL